MWFYSKDKYEYAVFTSSWRHVRPLILCNESLWNIWLKWAECFYRRSLNIIFKDFTIMFIPLKESCSLYQGRSSLHAKSQLRTHRKSSKPHPPKKNNLSLKNMTHFRQFKGALLVISNTDSHRWPSNRTPGPEFCDLSANVHCVTL